MDFSAKIDNKFRDFLDDKMHKEFFLDYIVLVEKRIFLWYDTENIFETKKICEKR